MGPYFFFGGAPGKALPSIDRYPSPLRATHNKDGVRPERTNHVAVPGTEFRSLETIDDVLVALFGSALKPTIADTVRAMVRAGKSNAEIWATIQPQFELTEDKKYYPRWYRNQMKRKGIR